MFRFFRRIYWKICLKRKGINPQDLRQICLIQKWFEEHPRSSYDVS